ncbi:LysR substrate-binding domain-containing protein [Pseudomonas sp. 148P]|uniref:LysR substrate-binding domain-containing protein n=1 Tax=Pseudomonas ulcerans TaxID=3115852 RepID=A0ABU7I180_9PSED|nr:MULTISPECIES: LysR substrate-binding domain-containing protein [unclassified Pseudomonas]MEE1926146.1 LysR substrate-binding domain-containing protein [Pseudomonas sp. 147P]MEE1937453.1 LysR substrate-binding domain-containing protein [Pseudomonas sp. 148P]
MFTHLPLNALRYFEAVARLGSLKRAAEELSVTPSAVSLQVKSLEEWLGKPVFDRTGSGLVLTLAGERVFSSAHRVLYELSVVLDEQRTNKAVDTLNVTTTPEFAALWLVPRLEAFYQLRPDIRIRVVPGGEVVDLLRNHEFHLAIRASSKDYPALYQEHLFSEQFGVFAAPHLLQRAGDDPPRLIDLAWGSNANPPLSWRDWCQLAGLQAWLGKELLGYHDEHLALQAAIAGQGYVLASCVLAANSVKAGLLVPYRPELVLPGSCYTALCTPGKERHAGVRAFLDWLRAQT